MCDGGPASEFGRRASASGIAATEVDAGILRGWSCCVGRCEAEGDGDGVGPTLVLSGEAMGGETVADSVGARGEPAVQE
jgi:hypothetical protein